MQKERRSKAPDDFAKKRPPMLNQREPKIIGPNRMQVVLPCPLPPQACRVKESTSSLKGFAQLSHKEMIESLLSSEAFPGLRQHAAALLPSNAQNDSLDLVFNDPLGLEVDLFHPHTLYDPQPSNTTVSTNGSYSSQNGEPTRDEEGSSLPLEDMFLINPQLYFDFVAQREKEAKLAQEQKQEVKLLEEAQIPQYIKPQSIKKEKARNQSDEEKEKDFTDFQEVQKYKLGFQDEEQREIVEVCEILPQLWRDSDLGLSIANLEVKASQPSAPGSHLFAFDDINSGQGKKPARLQSFTKFEGLREEEGAKFKEQATILALTKKSEDIETPLALVGAYSQGNFVTQPIFNRFKTSTLEKLAAQGQSLLVVPPGSEKLEDLGKRELELKQDQQKEDEGDQQGQNDYLSDDMGLAMLHGGPMVEQAPLQSEDEQGF